MQEPHKFPATFAGVMVFLTCTNPFLRIRVSADQLLVLFGGAGALAYLTFGSEVQTTILVNLDTKNRMVQSVQFLYALAILLSIPLQLFPAVRILENGFFTRSGKADFRVKWQKNIFRFAMVISCTVLSWVGAADLDKFVSLVGCFAWYVFMVTFSNFLQTITIFLVFRFVMFIQLCCIIKLLREHANKS